MAGLPFGMDSIRIDQANEAVRDWGKLALRKLRLRVAALTLKDRTAIIKRARLVAKNPDYKRVVISLGLNYKRDFGQIGRINFKFTRHGIFLEHGVGKGRPVRSSKARPKPWIAPILDPEVERLADVIAKEYADLALREIRFNVPGIVSKNIKVNNG